MQKNDIDRIINIVKVALEIEELSESILEDNLQDLGLESFAFIRIIVSLEDEFGIEIPDELLYMEQLDTISKIVNVVERILYK